MTTRDWSSTTVRPNEINKWAGLLLFETLVSMVI